MSKNLKIAIAMVLSFVLLSTGFIGGFATAAINVPGFTKSVMAAAGSAMNNERDSTGSVETTTAVELAGRVNEVESLLDTKALQPSTLTSATAGAINGILEATGDEWAAYYPPVEADKFDQKMNGSFGGIGVVLTEKDGTAVVDEVYADAPAQAAGVLAGDRFLVIDGKKQDVWTIQEASELVRGEKGTDVTITFFRPDKDDPKKGEELTKTITRDDIKVKNLMTKTYDNVGYMMMSSFNANSTDEVKAAIEKFDKEGVDGYVLDLRYNGGGLLEQSINIASLFLDPGVVVKTEDRDGVVKESDTTLKKITDKPLVVLVNGHSASASEVLAGALKDYDRAVLVGEKTFGKGSVQEVIELTFGGTIKFTTAHWLTPKDHMIDGQGIEPDVKVKNSMDSMKDGEKYDYKKDAQLMKSIQEVKKQ